MSSTTREPITKVRNC